MIAENIVHSKVSVSTFKGLLRNMPQMRFVIEIESNTLYVANAHNFIHCDIKSNAEIDGFEHLHGYAHYTEEDGFQYRISATNTMICMTFEERHANTLIVKMESAGFSRVTEPFSFEW
jgi:hypothetical protein